MLDHIGDLDPTVINLACLVCGLWSGVTLNKIVEFVIKHDDKTLKRRWRWE